MLSGTPPSSQRIARAGMKSYARLATLAHQLQAGRVLFVHKPEMHYLHQFVVDLLTASNSNRAWLHCLAYSCSAAEDFRGRTSLLSRSVHAATSLAEIAGFHYLGCFPSSARACGAHMVPSCEGQPAGSLRSCGVTVSGYGFLLYL